MLDSAKIKPIYMIMNLIRNYLIVLLFGFIITVGAINIFLRYMPGFSSMKWPDEILRYLNIWVIFFGASIGVRMGSHLKIDYFVQKIFSQKTSYLIRKGTYIIMLGTLAFLIVIGTDKFFSMFNVYIQAFPITISVFYLAIPVGCLLMFVDYLLIFLYEEHPFKDIDQADKKE